MNNNRKGFKQYCKNRIKNNNNKIKKLRNKVSEYEAIIDVINKTDLNKQVIKNYRQKIEVCLNQIDNYLESNKNNYDLIANMQSLNEILINSQEKRRVA